MFIAFLLLMFSQYFFKRHDPKKSNKSHLSYFFFLALNYFFLVEDAT